MTRRQRPVGALEGSVTESCTEVDLKEGVVEQMGWGRVCMKGLAHKRRERQFWASHKCGNRA